MLTIINGHHGDGDRSTKKSVTFSEFCRHQPNRIISLSYMHTPPPLFRILRHRTPSAPRLSHNLQPTSKRSERPTPSAMILRHRVPPITHLPPPTTPLTERTQKQTPTHPPPPSTPHPLPPPTPP